MEAVDSSFTIYNPQLTQPDNTELAAKVVSLLSCTLLSLLFGIKTFNVHYNYLSYSRWLVLALYLLSWSFTVTSMILVTTNNKNYMSCFLSIMVCDIFYSSTKIVIYAWLIEKVYVVSSIRQIRWKSKAYRFHAALMMPYIIIFTLMASITLVFHISEIDASGMCIIGLQSVASLPLLIYDFAINLYMTFFFIKPIMKLGSAGVKISTDANSKSTTRLNEVALRTLVASVVCLIISFTNVLALIILSGRERGLVCLTCCTVDVTANVMTIHWVTTQTHKAREGGGSMNNLDTSNQRPKLSKGSFNKNEAPQQSPNLQIYPSNNDIALADLKNNMNNTLLDTMDISKAMTTRGGDIKNDTVTEKTFFGGFPDTINIVEQQKRSSKTQIKTVTEVIAPPYSVLDHLFIDSEESNSISLSTDKKSSDESLAESNILSCSSIHESQSSRKSLTK